MYRYSCCLLLDLLSSHRWLSEGLAPPDSQAIDDFRSFASRCADADWCWMFTYQQDQSGIISLAVVAMLPIFACIFADVDLHNLSDKSLCTYVCPDQ